MRFQLQDCGWKTKNLFLNLTVSNVKMGNLKYTVWRNKMESNKFKAKGDISFYVTGKGIDFEVHDKDFLIKKYKDETLVDKILENEYAFYTYNLMDGMKFLAYVNDGMFIDYDGSISEVFVDGYVSNLGLKYKGISQGEFKVNSKMWKKICSEHEVLVNWANR